MQNPGRLRRFDLNRIEAFATARGIDARLNHLDRQILAGLGFRPHGAMKPALVVEAGIDVAQEVRRGARRTHQSTSISMLPSAVSNTTMGFCCGAAPRPAAVTIASSVSRSVMETFSPG